MGYQRSIKEERRWQPPKAPANQMGLFDPAKLEPAEPEPLTIDERFDLFHAANPHVYNALVRLARQLVDRGHKRYGMAGLFEVLRYRHALTTIDDLFKLNNDYKALYSRLIMEQETDLAGFFEIRERTAKGAKE